MAVLLARDGRSVRRPLPANFSSCCDKTRRRGSITLQIDYQSISHRQVFLDQDIGAQMQSAYTLGLDLGPNSIGWSLVDEQSQRIVAAGVRVFPEGVDRDQQGGEHSKSEQRRI